MRYKILLLFIFLLSSCSNDSKVIYVLFDSVETLDKNSKVTCNGIEIGKINDINLFGNQVIVELSIINKYSINKESFFYIKQDGLLDNGHIDVKINLKNNQKIKPNDTLKGFNNKTNNIDKLLKLLERDSIFPSSRENTPYERKKN